MSVLYDYDCVIAPTLNVSVRRYNKHVKNLVRDPSHPEAHFANSVSQNVSAHYLNLANSTHVYDMLKEPLHNCVLSVPLSGHPTSDELADLRMVGCRLDCFSCTFFAVTHIMGIHFRSGEWGKKPRCGSVVTCVLEGRSLYGRVRRFLTVEGDSEPGYASIHWLGEPEYSLRTPLVVKVGDDGEDIDGEVGCIVRITDIDPSRVMVECTRTDGYYVMRDSGYDTIRTI